MFSVLSGRALFADLWIVFSWIAILTLFTVNSFSEYQFSKSIKAEARTALDLYTNNGKSVHTTPIDLDLYECAKYIREFRNQIEKHSNSSHSIALFNDGMQQTFAPSKVMELCKNQQSLELHFTNI